MIASYGLDKHLFGGKTKRKEVFDKIAKAFNQRSKRIASGEQCMRKWNKMVKRQKEIQDHSNKLGNDRKTWKYYEKLSQYLTEEVSINPVRTMESSLQVQLDNHLEDELDGSTSDPDGALNGGGSSLTFTRGKKRCRKRPASRSSAAAQFLTRIQRKVRKKQKMKS